MFRLIRLLKDSAADRKKLQNHPRDDSGMAILTMVVRDDSNFLSPYSGTEAPVISEEVAMFLQNSAKACHPKEKMALYISSDCIDNQEEIIYRDAIHNYFSLVRKETHRDLKRNLFFSLAMFFVGILGLIGMFIAEFVSLGQLWVEVIDIFAWVFIWEAVDLFFIERRILRLKLARQTAFSEMPITMTAIPPVQIPSEIL